MIATDDFIPVSRQDQTSYKGLQINQLDILFFIFLTLKLCNIIQWSWWWVTAPIWMPFVFGVTVVLSQAFYEYRHGK